MGNAESSKRFSRRILAQAAMFAVMGMSATHSHAAATDTWVGPSSDINNNSPGSNWATASNWSIVGGVGGQTIPNGAAAAANASDGLVVNENDANQYYVFYDQFSLTTSPKNNWFTSLTAGNANASGGVNFNISNGGVFNVSGAVNFTSNATLTVGNDGGTQGLITVNGTTTLANNSSLNVGGNSVFTDTAAATFSTGSSFTLSAVSLGTAQTATFNNSKLNVSGGSTFNTTAGVIFQGANLSSQAIVNITGSSFMNIGGANSNFGIGTAGFGTINLESGSSLTDAGVESAGTDDHFGGLRVGQSTNGNTATSGGTFNTAGSVIVPTGRLAIGIMEATSGGTGTSTTAAATGLVSMTGGSWTQGGNVLIGMDASSAGNGTATGAVGAFGLAHGELDISGGTFNMNVSGKQIFVGASSATGVLNVSGSGILTGSSGIQVGTTFDYLANTAGVGVNGADVAIPGTGTFIVSGSGSVTTGIITVGASSSVNVSGGSLTATTITANSGSTFTTTGGNLTLNSLVVNAGSSVNLSGTTTFNGLSPSITLNGGAFSALGSFNTVALNYNASTNFMGAAAGGTQGFGVLNFGTDSTVTSTYGGSGTDILSFAGLNRPVGITGNFLSVGGTNGVTNKIVIGSQTPNTFISQGIFFGGSNFAWYDSAGFVRGIAYGSDPGAITTGATTSVAGTYVQTTGAVSAEATNTFTTLAITGAFNFGLAGGATLTVNGIDKSGTGASIISGGTGIQPGSNAELVIRSDSATDSLTISSSILANGTNVVTKSGAGSVTLSGVNTYTGGTIITNGTLVDGSSGGLPSTGSITINPGGTLDLNSQSATIGGLTLSGGGFTNTGGGGSLSLNGDVVSLTSPSTFSSGIFLTPAAATGAAVRTFNVSGSNAVSDLTLSGPISKGGASPVTLLKIGTGTLTLSGANSASSFSTLQVTKGTLRIDGNTGTLTDGLVNLTLGAPVSTAGAFKYDNTTSTGPRTNAMGALSFASGDGTVTSVQTAAQNVALTFGSISRTPGATGNLVVTGGTNGTTNKINITSQAAGFIDPGIYFNGGNFAWEDTGGAGGFVRGINYGTDPNSASTAGATAISPTAATYLQVTAPLSAQSSTQLTGLMLRSLNLVGANSNVSGGTHNTIQMIDSIDKSGGGLAQMTVSGTLTTLTPNADLIIRTDTAADSFLTSYTIQGNGNSGLVKSGAGTFTMGTNANLYTGDTIVAGGTLTQNGTTDTSNFRGSTLNYNNFGGIFIFGTNTITTLGGLKGSQNLPLVNNSSVAESLILGSAIDNQSTTYSGVLSGLGNLTKAGTGTLTLSGVNTYTGPTNVSNGVLELTSTGSLASPSLILGSNVASALGLTQATSPNTPPATFTSGVTLLLDAGQVGANFNSGTTLIVASTSQISASGITGTLALGALNRSAGSAIDFGVLPTGSGSITTTTANTAFTGGQQTILGGYAIVNQTTWAVSGSGATPGIISGLPTGSYSTSFVGATDVDAPISSSSPGTMTINSLRLNNAGAITVTGTASDTLTIASGGILETTGPTAATISIPNLTSGTTELIIDQANIAAPLGISSNISGGIGVTKAGVGTVTLSGVSSYTGPTTLANGTLAITSDAAVNNGVGGFQFSSGTLQLNNYTSSLNFTNVAALRLGGASGTSTLAGNINLVPGSVNLSSGLVYAGPGTLILSGNNTYTGATTINGGTLKAGSITALGNQSTYTLANVAGVSLDITGFNNSIGSLIGGGPLGGNITLGSATLSVVGDQFSASYANSPVYAGVISGLGGIVKKAGTVGTFSAGVLTLTGVNLYSGSTNLSGGVLAITADTAVNNGSGGFLFTGGTLQFNNYSSNLAFANLTGLNLGSSQGLNIASTLTGAITGSSKLTYVGPGILTLAPSPATANNYAGGTNVSAGTLAISADNALGSGAFQFSTGTLQLDNYTSSLNFPSVANLKLGAASGTASRLNGNISGTSPFTFNGPGTLVLASPANNYSGGTTVAAGTLQMGTGATLGNTSTGLTVSPGGTLDLNGTNQTVNALNGATGTGFILNNNTSTNVTLTIGNGNTAGTFGGGILNNSSGTGTVALTKIGTAIETLSRADNTYSGMTTISAGTLTAGVAGAFSPNSEVLMANASGATLNVASLANTIGSLTGGGTAGGNVNLGSGILTIGNDNTSPAAYAGIINNSGGITKIGTGTLILGGVNTYTGATLVTGGTLEIAPAGNVSAGSAATALTVNASTGAAGLKLDARSATGIVPITFASMNLSAGGTVTLATGGSHNNRMKLITSTLTNTGNIDLGGNDMIIHNTTTAIAGTTLTAVTGQLTSGFSGGTWAGTANGSIRSSVAAADTTHLTALGSVTGLTSFDGGTVLNTDVLLKYTYFGDADLSGVVDGSDYSRIDNAFLNNSNISNPQLTGWFNGDFNYDSVVNGSDYTLIDNAFNSQGATLAAQLASPSAIATAEIAGGGSTSSVPEPTTLGLLGLGVVGLLGRRGSRRHR